MSHLLKNLIIALGVTLVLGVLYVTFFGGDESEKVSTTVREKHDAELQTEKILANIQEITEYEIDDTIFEDARFRALTDYGVDIKDVRTGRSNPFQPVR